MYFATLNPSYDALQIAENYPLLAEGWCRRTSPPVFIVDVLSAQAQAFGPGPEIDNRQIIHVERLFRRLASRARRDADRDLVLAWRHVRGCDPADRMVGIDINAGADIGHWW